MARERWEAHLAQHVHAVGALAGLAVVHDVDDEVALAARRVCTTGRSAAQHGHRSVRAAAAG